MNMKKILMLAMAAVLAFSVNATDYKYVSPITIEPMQFNIQELRDSAINHDSYIASLNALQKELQAEKAVIEDAQKELKLEHNLYDAELSLFKNRQKQLTGMKKNLQNNVKTLDGYLKDIKKQYDIIKKMSNVKSEPIREHERRLNESEKQIKDEKKHAEDLLEDLSGDVQKEVNDAFSVINDFLIELTDKETRLKNIATQNKTNQEIVKAALKTANSK